MNIINFFIVKLLVKVKFANIINIAANEEVLPELLQQKCTAKNIFSNVDKYLNDPKLSLRQVNKFKEIIKDFKTNNSSELASLVLINNL